MPFIKKYIDQGVSAYANCMNQGHTTDPKSTMNKKSMNTMLPSLSETLLRNMGITSKTQCDAVPAPPPPLPPPPTTGLNEPPPPAAPDKASSSSSPEEDSISKAAKGAGMEELDIPNPGPYEGASMDAGKRLVSLDTHDGFRCDINKQLSPFFLIVHSFWLGTSMIPDGRNKTYSFVAQVASDNGLLMARTDPERGSVDGRVHVGLLGGMAMGKLQLGLSGAGTGADGQGGGGQNDQVLAEIDFGGQTWTGNLRYGSVAGGLMYGCNYFQSVTKRLALGGEGVYIGTNKSLLSSYSMKYTFPNLSSTPLDEERVSIGSNKDDEMKGSAVMYANYNAAQGLLSVNYKRVVTPDRVTLGAELQCSPMTLDSQVVLGAEVNLQRSKLNVCVDGSGRIQSVLEAKLGIAPGSPTLNFAAEVDHGKDLMRFGYGLNIGG